MSPHPNTSIRRATALALLAFSGAAWAQAQPAGLGLTLKAGAIHYAPDVRTTGLRGVGLPPGADATVDSVNAPLFTLSYRFAPSLSAELVFGVPRRIQARAVGNVAFLGEVANARLVAPALLVNYHFGGEGAALRPYLGLGINYTRFDSARSPLGLDVKLGDSLGWAAHAGVDWRMAAEWGVWASVGLAKVESRLVATSGAVIETTIDFRPRTLAGGLYYRF